MKILFTIAIIFVGYFVLKGLFSSRSSARVEGARRSTPTDGSGGGGGVKAPRGEMTVQCPACGTFTPVSAASHAGSGGDMVYFCSDACRQSAGV